MPEAKDESCLSHLKREWPFKSGISVDIWNRTIPTKIHIEAFFCKVMAQVVLLKVHFSEIKHQTAKAFEQL